MMMTSVLLTSCKSDDDNFYEAVSSVSEIAGSWIAAYNNVWWFVPTDTGTVRYEYNASNTAVKITAKTGNEGSIIFYDYDPFEKKWEPGLENPFTLKDSKMYITYADDGTKDTIKVESIGRRASERKKEKNKEVESMVLDCSFASDEKYDVNYISYEKVGNIDEWEPEYEEEDFYNDCAEYVDFAEDEKDDEIGIWVLTSISVYNQSTGEFDALSMDELSESGYMDMTFHKDTMTLSYSLYDEESVLNAEIQGLFDIDGTALRFSNILKESSPFPTSDSDIIDSRKPETIFSQLRDVLMSADGCIVDGFFSYYDKDFFEKPGIAYGLSIKDEDKEYWFSFDWWSETSLDKSTLKDLLKNTKGAHPKRVK